MVDWQLAEHVAEGDRGAQPAPGTAAVRARRRGRPRSARARLGVHRAAPREPLPDRRGGRPRRPGSSEPALAGGGARPGRRARSAAAWGRSPAPCGRGRRALLAVEAGAHLGLPRPARARPVRVPDARARGAGAAAVRRARTSPRPRRARRRRRRAAALGRAARDHARAAVRRRAVAARRTSPAWCASCSARSTSTRRGLLRPARRCSDLRGLVDAVREGGLAALVVGPERRALLDRMQAFMAVLEGYAEHVMDAVGAERAAGPAEAARRAGAAPRATAPALLRLLREADRDGPEAAPVRAGQALLRRRRRGAAASRRSTASGTGPEQLPTLAELDDPDGWLARTTRGIAPVLPHA